MPVHMPAEWAEQDWLWIGFPHDAELWLDDLVPAQEQIAAFANTVAESGQQVRLVVRDAANEMRAHELVSRAVTCGSQLRWSRVAPCSRTTVASANCGAGPLTQ